MSLKERCICKICECGKHKCPYKCKSLNNWGSDVCSEYGRQYHHHNQGPTPSFKPPLNSIRSDCPLSDQTTNRMDYVKHDVQPPLTFGQPAYEPPKEPMDATSVYRNEYTQMAPCAAKPIKPISGTLDNGKFADETTSRSTYVPFDVCPPERREHQKYIPPTAPLASETSNRADYVDHHNFVPPMSYKPPSHQISSTEPFTKQTTNRDTYVSHNVSPPEKFYSEKYEKPQGDMDLLSTYNQQFLGQTCARTAAIKPPHTAIATEPFDGQTSYRQNYVNWEQCANIVQHRDKYQPTTAPFDDKTTSKTAYVPHNVDKTPSFKPPVHSLESQPFYSDTCYRTQYVDREIPVCPASILPPKHEGTLTERPVSPHGYMYSCEDDEGHRYYTKTSVTVK